jgi:RNA polymerase-binding protein DksA
MQIKVQKEKTRYSESELKEFKEILLTKLAGATAELANLLTSLKNSNGGGSSNIMGDGPAHTAETESTNALADRQRKFIDQLSAALVRIENKTYGICRETGKLIPKGRLLAVPHTTLCIEAKEGRSAKMTSFELLQESA